jgi:hypothetical protein
MSDSAMHDESRSASASSKEERERERELDEEGIIAAVGDVEAARERNITEKLNAEPEEEPFLVKWNGDDDPGNPLNFKTRRKVSLMIMIALIAFLTYSQLLLK